MFFKIIGGLVVLWGIADLIIGLQGGDLWAQIGIHLPDLIWQYSHYIAIIAGAGIFSLGGDKAEKAPRD